MNPGSLTNVFSVIEQSFKASTKKHTKNKQPFISVFPLLQNHEFPENVLLGPLRCSDIAKVTDFPVKRHIPLQNLALHTWLFVKYCAKIPMFK